MEKYSRNNSCENVNYVDLFNLTVPDKWFALKPDNQRIEELLRKECSAVSVVCRKTKGRKRKMLDDKVYRLSILRGDIETTDSLKTEVGIINEEFEEFKEKYNDLEKEKNTLYEEMIFEVNKLKQEVCDLKYVKKELMGNIDTLEKKDSLMLVRNNRQGSFGILEVRQSVHCGFVKALASNFQTLNSKMILGQVTPLITTHPLLVSQV